MFKQTGFKDEGIKKIGFLIIAHLKRFKVKFTMDIDEDFKFNYSMH